MKKYAVIVAGGSGSRMGSSVPKQFMLLDGKPVLWHTLQRFRNSFNDINIILVLPEPHLDTGVAIVESITGLSTDVPITGSATPLETSKVIAASAEASASIKIVCGGETRFHSVLNGLNEVPEGAVVFVHDGVRCLVSASLIQHCYTVALEKGNAIPAISAVDSMRIETDKGNEMLDRSRVKLIQTPQTFLSTVLKSAFNQLYNASFTDEASVAEAAGVSINLVEGEASNIKITGPLDILIAREILKSWGRDSIKQ